jgi:integrase
LNRLCINAAYAADLPGEQWTWPVDAARYDRSPKLTKAEVSALGDLADRQRYGFFRGRHDLDRLTRPILDVIAVTCTPKQSGDGAIGALILEMAARRTAYWSWTDSIWIEILRPSMKAFRAAYPWTNGHGRQILFAAAYLLGLFDDFRRLGLVDRTALACRIFGRNRVQVSIRKVIDLIRGWGYSRFEAKDIQWAVCTMLLAHKSPNLEDITAAVLEAERAVETVHYRRASISVLARVLVSLGVLTGPISPPARVSRRESAKTGVALEWLGWVERWRSTCTIQPGSRQRHYVLLLKAGRWVTQLHPQCASPERWTRELAAEWVGAVCRMNTGEWTAGGHQRRDPPDRPLSPKAKAHHLASLAAFFRDIQEWGWIPRRFDPRRCFAAPRSLRALIGPSPRVIADDVWAKLLWAGLNLAQTDLGSTFNGTHYYPLGLVKALTVVWLFCGLRVDEIRRLRVGCVRLPLAGADEAQNSVCYLDVPVNKTSAAFTKPVDGIVGAAIRTWEAERPAQPPLIDDKTGDVVHFLFMFRGKRIAHSYINDTLIPALCKKAGVPSEDARGNITSHRARSTIASQLFNSKEPMSLFELQRWLGHRWAASTQHYLDISPTKLAASYRDAGYFARNTRAVEVLIDREAVVLGGAAAEPWRYYDLGHGFCTYDFFDQCPHRMACAKCGFYVPKESARGMTIEGRANLLRMRQEIPLNEAELAAVEDGAAAMQKLLDQLENIATPAGPTPRQLRAPNLVQIAFSPPHSKEGGS